MHAATTDHENSLPDDTRIMGCDSLVGRLRDICRGHDDDGNPVLTVRQCNAYRRNWGLDDLYADSIATVHADQSVILPIASESQETLTQPSLIAKAVSFTKAAATHVADGCRDAAVSEIERRIEICRTCNFFDAAKKSCRKCGCGLVLKTRWRTSHCPIDLW